MRLGTHYKLKYLPASIFIDYVLQVTNNEQQAIYGIELQPNNNADLIISTSSNKQDLKINSLYKDIMAGLAIGIRINLGPQVITIAFKNLGAAGNCIGVGATF